MGKDLQRPRPSVQSSISEEVKRVSLDLLKKSDLVYNQKNTKKAQLKISTPGLCHMFEQIGKCIHCGHFTGESNQHKGMQVIYKTKKLDSGYHENVCMTGVMHEAQVS